MGEQTIMPLHAKVAETLGWSGLEAKNGLWPDDFVGYPQTEPIINQKVTVPMYDRDWGATGPLVEKYGISLSQSSDTTWIAFAANVYVRGVTPLSAVCHLLLALNDAGKL